MGKHHDLSICRQLTEIVGKPRWLRVPRRATGIEALHDDEVGDLVIKRAMVLPKSWRSALPITRN